LLGSAKYIEGIKELLDAITTLLFQENKEESSELSGIVYKLQYDKQFGKMASVRLFSGSIRNRDLIPYGSQGKENKVTQIKKTYSQKLETIDTLQAGDTALLCGLEDVIAGDIIGSDPKLIKKLELCKYTGLSDPLLTVKLEPENDTDYSALVSAVKELSEEDPTLSFVWLKDERELHIKIMGKIQVEILESVFKQRFDLDVTFGDPIVIYKETPAKKGEGYDEYTMPKPCWAVVRFDIEPLERGSGVIYESKVGVDKIAAKYQNEIKATIDEALAQGIYGWQVTDLKITLIGEEDHVIHSRPGDFILATKLAMMDGLINTGCKLLEPVVSFKITAPEESSGKIISSLIAIRAEIGSPENIDGKIIIDGKIPVATSLDYVNTLNSITAGKGKYLTHFHGYQEVSLELGQTMPYRGINPKDRSKYILKHRGAIK
ncbi:MAG: GTP-binding protein, partial [Candidatus Delongbacteria bacterium]|nr:GTP-binding protein [Candidatus Delongbacteria bacterium]